MIKIKVLLIGSLVKFKLLKRYHKDVLYMTFLYKTRFYILKFYRFKNICIKLSIKLLIYFNFNIMFRKLIIFYLTFPIDLKVNLR